MPLLELMLESEQFNLHALGNGLEKIILILHLELATLDFCDVLNHLNIFNSSYLEIVTLQFRREQQLSRI